MPVALAMAAIPPSPGLKEVIIAGLENFIEKRCEVVSDALIEFTGQGLRSDGNIKLARRMRKKSGEWFRQPYNCLLAWCGVDGSFLRPVSPVHSESFETISKDMETLLDRMHVARSRQGLCAVPTSLDRFI